MSFWIPEPYFLAPGEALPLPLDTGRTAVKVTGAQTGNRFGLFESHMPPHSPGPGLHVHHIMTEMFFVHAGVVEVIAGDKRSLVPAGGFALVPPETPHRFANPTDEPAILLIMFSPGDQREGYIAGLEALARREQPPSREEMIDLMRRFDQTPIEEPRVRILS